MPMARALFALFEGQLGAGQAQAIPEATFPAPVGGNTLIERDPERFLRSDILASGLAP
jgi:hypothetical protein